ncbi:hypothetical protein NAL32_20885 [Chryseobacterium sp. Ch-15]|uniref:Uncharacterized protein n=1 Tax=Chryseobacterium muglaense TaxID=2893752 RepID=A0A9Q3UQY6_9FLAO|nr:hypothetical protein [Chryseobacterium muglaense]MBD3904409.1 hypothetical protein [Chryseobacterium muglaense]MCC9032757.1 hypothetical protein [Chryseobacterium muglaense]MCM2556848.1 hypothetical protein [Chryseobacterium muglaense]
MENPILEAKKELIQWIKEMDELEDIAELLELKEQKTSGNKVAEAQSEYIIKDDFDERFAKGIPHEEMKKRTFAFIESLPWKQ